MKRPNRGTPNDDLHLTRAPRDYEAPEGAPAGTPVEIFRIALQDPPAVHLAVVATFAQERWHYSVTDSRGHLHRLVVAHSQRPLNHLYMTFLIISARDITAGNSGLLHALLEDTFAAEAARAHDIPAALTRVVDGLAISSRHYPLLAAIAREMATSWREKRLLALARPTLPEELTLPDEALWDLLDQIASVALEVQHAPREYLDAIACEDPALAERRIAPYTHEESWVTSSRDMAARAARALLAGSEREWHLEFDRAEHLYRVGLRCEPLHRPLLLRLEHGLGRVLVVGRRYAEALEHLDAVGRYGVTPPATHGLRHLALAALGRRYEAGEAQALAWNADPTPVFEAPIVRRLLRRIFARSLPPASDAGGGAPSRDQVA